MKRFFGILLAVALLSALAAGACLGADAAAEQKPMLRTAIFVQNRAGEQFQDKLDVLNDLITTRLTEKGFSIIDKAVVIEKFREARERVAAKKPGEQSDSPIEDAIAGASALRTAQMVAADYLVVATITSLSHETRSFAGYGTATENTVYHLRISLKVLEGNQGGSVYGDSVTVSDQYGLGQNLKVETSDIIPKLLDAGARKIADNISDKVNRIRDVKVKSLPTVELTINCNVDGATIELDGAAIGSAPGRFNAAPGLHTLRVSKQWLTPWERTVNIFPNQILSVTLELSEEGMRRYTTIEQLKVDLARTKQQNDMEMKERETALGIAKQRSEAEVGIAKEQSEAEAYAKKKVSEGEKTRREESYERIEGPNPGQTNIIK